MQDLPVLGLWSWPWQGVSCMREHQRVQEQGSDANHTMVQRVRTPSMTCSASLFAAAVLWPVAGTCPCRCAPLLPGCWTAGATTSGTGLGASSSSSEAGISSRSKVGGPGWLCSRSWGCAETGSGSSMRACTSIVLSCPKRLMLAPSGVMKLLLGACLTSSAGALLVAAALLPSCTAPALATRLKLSGKEKPAATGPS